MVIVVGGMIGLGKTSVAELLGRELDLRFFMRVLRIILFSLSFIRHLRRRLNRNVIRFCCSCIF